jgi:hypothetical protein
VHDALGTPPGALGSPVIAHVYVEKVLDPGGAPRVQAHCRGAVALMRYADTTRLRVGGGRSAGYAGNVSIMLCPVFIPACCIHRA